MALFVVRTTVLAAIAGLFLAGCGGDEKVPLPGERQAVMVFDRDAAPDPRIADLSVILPRSYANEAWTQTAGAPSHAMHHLALGQNPKEAWSVDIGAGASSERALMTVPVVAGDRIFTMDADFEVRAFNVKNGEELWSFEPNIPDEDDEAFGGGIAYDNERLFVSTGFGGVIALDAKKGRPLWLQKLPGPARSAPTVAGERVYALTIDNQLVVLDAATGRRLWTHTTVSESAGLLGGSSPAVNGSTVVVPYSSGELFTMRAENGRVVWSDNLTAFRRMDALATLAHIRASPVIDRGMVLAISNSGLLVAIDQRNGRRLWERRIGGVDTPWVAGDFIFVLSNEGELFCLMRAGGRVRWIRPLPRYVKPEKKEDPIRWSGPVLAGDRLVVIGSHGVALTISPYTGELLGRQRLPDRITLPPVVAENSIYFLTEDADLIAFR
jgi:outer membrane protein assembly factor BamB